MIIDSTNDRLIRQFQFLGGSVESLPGYEPPKPPQQPMEGLPRSGFQSISPDPFPIQAALATQPPPPSFAHRLMQGGLNLARVNIPQPIRQPIVRGLGEGLQTALSGGPLLRGVEQGLSRIPFVGEPVKKVEDVRAKAALEAADVLVPREVWDTALTLLPAAKARTIPELLAAISIGDVDAVRAVRQAGERLGQSEAVQRFIVAGERGELKLPGEGGEIKKAAENLLPEAPIVPAVGAPAGPPELPPLTEALLPGDERGRVAKLIASGVEKQGPVFATQEMLRSQERSQRFAQVRALRRDFSLSPEEKTKAIKGALAGEYYHGEYTPLEIGDADFALAERIAAEHPQNEGDYLSTLLALGRLQSGQGLREFEQIALGNVFGPEVLKAIRSRDTSMVANIARTWGVSDADVKAAVRAEELARPTGKIRPSAVDTPEEVAARQLSGKVGAALDAVMKRSVSRQARRDAAELKMIDDALQTGARQSKREYESFLKKNPNAEQLAEQARNLIPDNPVSRPTRDLVGNAIDKWERGNQALLNGVGETRGFQNLYRLVESAFSGQVTDSFVAKLAVRQMQMESALLRSGIDKDYVAKIGQMLFDREVQLRYGMNVPEGVQRSIDMLKAPSLQGNPVALLAENLAEVSESFKNAMFGVGDIAVFGVQARAALQGGWIPGLIGSINRSLTTMHLPHFASLQLADGLPREVSYILDGLHYGRGPSAVTAEGSTPLRYLNPAPGVGKVSNFLDTQYGRVANTLSDWQFRTVLGGVRETLYEGNLMLLKVLGRDIRTPSARAKAAEWANMLTGASELAQTGVRSKLERGFWVSPSMLRSSANELLQAAKFLSPKASAEQRILAATAIVSYGASWLAAGKLLDDWIGDGSFEMDPTKKGAGTITTKLPGMAGAISIPFMPNAALKRAFLQSARVIADGDPKEMGDIWARFVSARETTPARGVVGVTTGRGYTPSGKFSTDLTRMEIAQSLIPAPPIAQQAVVQGVRPIPLGLQVGGVSSYPESEFSIADKLIEEQGGDFQKAQAAATTTGDTETADIVTYRWRQDFEKRGEEFGLYIVKGTPDRSPSVEFKRWDESWETNKWSDYLTAGENMPKGSFDSLKDLRDAYVEKWLPASMKAYGTSRSEATTNIRDDFDKLQGVREYHRAEKQYRLDFWRAHPDLLEDAVAVGVEDTNPAERGILAGVP